MKDCQLQVIADSGSKPTFMDRLRLFLLRALSTLERKIAGLRRRLGQPELVVAPCPNIPSKPIGEHDRPAGPSAEGPFRPGDVVEVRSYDEVQATLDEKGFYDKLEFMEGMKNYCGRRLVVKKRVRSIFDERAWRMLTVRKSRYILDGAICDGSGQYDKEGCDRCCFYFWADRWLRRPSQRPDGPRPQSV